MVAPARRCRLMARLRRMAMTSGPLPVRAWWRSSPKVTSRTQWSLFSMCQWPRIQVARSAGWACSAGRVQMA